LRDRVVVLDRAGCRFRGNHGAMREGIAPDRRHGKRNSLHPILIVGFDLEGSCEVRCRLERHPLFTEQNPEIMVHEPVVFCDAQGVCKEGERASPVKRLIPGPD